MDEQNPLIPHENTGFIPVDPVATDWMAGAETGVVTTVRVPDYDWRPYLSPGKWQRFFWTSPAGVAVNLETDACVSFSAIDNLQAFLNYQIVHNLMSQDNQNFLKSNGYLDQNGKVNLSPRFTAKMSGTTTNGNSMPAVATSLRHNGAVPESLWPAPIAEIQQTHSPTDAWNVYYQTVPQHIIDLGNQFAARFDVQYDWIAYPQAPMNAEQFKQQLQTAPLQIATAVCPPWNTDQEIKACGAGTAHATLMDNVLPNNDYSIRDHYVPFDKIFATDYTITYALRMVAIDKTPVQIPALTHHFQIQMHLGDKSAEVKILQDALKIDGEFPKTVSSTGYYGSITQAAVLAFQVKHQVDTPEELKQLNGTIVGPKTLAALNNLFNK